MMKKFQYFTIFISLLLFNGILEIAQASSDSSNDSETPGFKLIASLLTLGVIAFLAPFLRKDKLLEDH